MDRRRYLMILALITLLGLLAGCESSDTGSGGEPDRDSTFVVTEESVGRIELTLLAERVPVGETAKFSVHVFDKAGNPVPQIRISCDSEKEIAIIEPTTGFELTDAWGQMSGVFGCAAPGSFQLACRLPIGANLRQFKTVVCEGEAPTGFTGWPDAAGGTLGGGVDTTDDDDDDEFSVRVTGISFDDGGNENTTSIDAAQAVCNPSTTPPTYEMFTDAVVSFTVVNDTNELIRFTSFNYVVRNYDGQNSSFASDRISLIGETSVEADGGSSSFGAVFMDATNGGKAYYGGTAIPVGGYGFKNIRFELNGTTASGDPITISASTSVSIDNYNNC